MGALSKRECVVLWKILVPKVAAIENIYGMIKRFFKRHPLALLISSGKTTYAFTSFVYTTLYNLERWKIIVRSSRCHLLIESIFQIGEEKNPLSKSLLNSR